MTDWLSKGLRGWLEKAPLKWVVVFGGSCGLGISPVAHQLHHFPSALPTQLLDCQIRSRGWSRPSLLGEKELPLVVLWVSEEINHNS